MVVVAKETKKQKITSVIYAILLPLTLFSVVVGTPVYMVFLGMTVYLLTLNKYELSVILMIAFPHIFGMIKEMVGINIPASAVLFSIVAIVLNIELRQLFNRKVKYILLYSSILFIVILFLFFLNSPSSKGSSKIIETLQTIICVFTAFSIIISYENISFKKIGIGFLFVACLYMWVAYNLFLYPHPSDFLDFTSFRDYSTQLKHMEAPNVSYHHLGYCGFYYISFLLADEKKKITIFDYIPLVISIWITLYAGGRQIMVGVAIIFFIWILLKGGKKVYSKLFLIAVLSGVSLIVINNLEIFSAFSDKSTSTDEKLNRNWDYAFQQIFEHPILGVGYGNYENPSTGEVYPHNIILEILCEMGIFGFLFISFVVVVAFFNERIKKRSFDKMRGVMIFFPYLLHGFISGSLGTNIQLFVIFFAIIVSAGLQVQNATSEYKPINKIAAKVKAAAI